MEITDLRAKLRTGVIGRHIVWCPVLDSTNDLAKALAKGGAPEGTIVIAGEQRRGRGRRGRAWLASPGTCILGSVLFYPGAWLPSPFYLTVACSLAVAEAIQEAHGLPAMVKWPNDVVIGRRKVAGLLTELVSEGSTLVAGVVGIGVNVNFDVQKLPEIRRNATSIAIELGMEVSVSSLLDAVLGKIDGNYRLLKTGGCEVLFARWQARLAGLGEEVAITTGGATRNGVLEEVHHDGSLTVCWPDGSKQRLTDAELSLSQLYID